MDYEEQVMGLIGAAGESKDYAFRALDALKEGKYDEAKELIAKSHESDVAAHNVQTQLISAEMDPEKESVPMTLLMAHAQDHFMTTQLARELVEHLIDIFEVQQGRTNISTSPKDNYEPQDNAADDEPGEVSLEQSGKNLARAKQIAKDSQGEGIRILLCCEGGLSTNLLMQEVKKVIKKSNKFDESKFDFDAIPVDELENKIGNWDVVLIGPQVGHKLKHVEDVCKKNNKPYTVIDKNVYGAMDGATVAKMAIILYRKNKLK